MGTGILMAIIRMGTKRGKTVSNPVVSQLRPLYVPLRSRQVASFDDRKSNKGLASPRHEPKATNGGPHVDTLAPGP